MRTILFPHQKQALSWMIACENNDSLPPFWEQKGPQNFFNLVTNHSSAKPPASVKGGILADDMGLGKTLEIIALIVTNFKNGKNLVTVDKTKPVNLETKVVYCFPSYILLLKSHFLLPVSAIETTSKSFKT